MSIKTEKIIQVDNHTIIDSPDIEITELLVKPIEKSITVTAKFTSGKTIVSREIGFYKYSDQWTISDIENFVLEFINQKEVKDTPIKK